MLIDCFNLAIMRTILLCLCLRNVHLEYSVERIYHVIRSEFRSVMEPDTFLIGNVYVSPSAEIRPFSAVGTGARTGSRLVKLPLNTAPMVRRLEA